MIAYFAYGSNLDRDGMRRRCPHAVPVGQGSLGQHRFFIMASGYASVRPERDAVVYGLLWTIPDADLPALDAYEEVDNGLYRKTHVPISRDGGAIVDSLIYIGQCTGAGQPRDGYMEAVIAAAASNDLPEPYQAELRGWLLPVS